MNLIYAGYNMYHNSIDCNKAEEGLKTTEWTDHVLSAMAIDNPLEYTRLYLITKCRYLYMLKIILTCKKIQEKICY